MGMIYVHIIVKNMINKSELARRFKEYAKRKLKQGSPGKEC